MLIRRVSASGLGKAAAEIRMTEQGFSHYLRTGRATFGPFVTIHARCLLSTQNMWDRLCLREGSRAVAFPPPPTSVSVAPADTPLLCADFSGACAIQSAWEMPELPAIRSIICFGLSWQHHALRLGPVSQLTGNYQGNFVIAVRFEPNHSMIGKEYQGVTRDFPTQINREPFHI